MDGFKDKMAEDKSNNERKISMHERNKYLEIHV